MKAGVVYPQTELGGDTGAVKAFAQAAENLGYDHIVIYDHVLGAEHAGREPKLTGPYKESDPFHEPLVTYAYLSGVTKNLGLTTGVIILPQRQTALRQTGCGCRSVLRRPASPWRRHRLELGGVRRSRNVGAFSPPRQAAGEADRLDPQALGRARGRLRGFRPPDRSGRDLAAPKTADPDLAGWLQRGGVRPRGPDRGRLPVFGPDAN